MFLFTEQIRQGKKKKINGSFLRGLHLLGVTNLIPIYVSVGSSKQVIRFWSKKNWILLHYSPVIGS